MIIALDGPAAAGKGTLARKIADYFDFAYLDTGGLYRATASKLLENKTVPENLKAAEQAALSLSVEDLERTDLRTEAVGQVASVIASQKDVRAALLSFQRSFALSPPSGKSGAVLDGRDIGTVVCPNADAKIFVTARPEIRAQRRLKELQSKGFSGTYEAVLLDLKERDERDRNRKEAPLKPAEDAFLLETSDLSIEEAFETALGLIEPLFLNR